MHQYRRDVHLRSLHVVIQRGKVKALKQITAALKMFLNLTQIKGLLQNSTEKMAGGDEVDG